MNNLNNWPLGGSLRSPHLGIRRAGMHKCRQRQDAESGLPSVGEMSREVLNTYVAYHSMHSTTTQDACSQDGQWSSYSCLTT